MNFNLLRHCRIAGVVVIFVGLYLKNTSIMILGNLLIVFSYMYSIAKMERYLEILDEKNDDGLL